MSTKRLFSFFAIGAVALIPALKPTESQASDEFVGAIVGGIIGSALSQQQRSSSSRSTSTRSASAPNPQRVANREMQTALNYFGFPVGVVDGSVGPKTRAAVSAYQTFMGFPPTGQLTSFERDILVGAMTFGQSGSPDAMQLVANDPNGSRALLIRQRDVMTGTLTATAPRSRGYPGIPLEVSQAVDEIAASSDPSAEQLLARSGFIQLADLNGDGNNDFILDTKFSGSSFWCTAAQCKTLVFVSTPQGFARNDLLVFNPTPASFQCFGATCQVSQAPTTTLAVTPVVPAPSPAPVSPPGDTVMVAQPIALAASAAPTAAIPSFGAAPSTDADQSLSSHCSKVGLLTSARGGFVTAGQGAPSLALSEQFCLARSFAIDLGETRVASLAGVTPDQVAAQYAAFEPLLAPFAAKLGTADRLTVLGEAGSFIVGSGMSPEQMKLTAEACLGVGYRKDTMDLAIGSAVMLVALGEAVYAELLGHHLTEGFGVSSDQALAQPWYGQAIGALQDGAQPVFAPADDTRTALLQWAAFDAANGVSNGETTPASAALPTFGVSE